MCDVVHLTGWVASNDRQTSIQRMLLEYLKPFVGMPAKMATLDHPPSSDTAVLKQASLCIANMNIVQVPVVSTKFYQHTAARAARVFLFCHSYQLRFPQNCFVYNINDVSKG